MARSVARKPVTVLAFLVATALSLSCSESQRASKETPREDKTQTLRLFVAKDVALTTRELASAQKMTVAQRAQDPRTLEVVQAEFKAVYDDRQLLINALYSETMRSSIPEMVDFLNFLRNEQNYLDLKYKYADLKRRMFSSYQAGIALQGLQFPLSDQLTEAFGKMFKQEPEFVPFGWPRLYYQYWPKYLEAGHQAPSWTQDFKAN